jgi:hypothetical protein
MVDVEILLPPIAVGEKVYSEAGEVIQLTEADVKMWEAGPHPVVRRVKASDESRARDLDAPAEPVAGEAPEAPKTPVKKR